MARVIQGKLDATGIRIAIIISRFNSFISERLLNGAMDALERNGAVADDVTVVWVPGSFEVVLAAKKAASSGSYEAVICLGALLQGETPHFEHISSAVTKGISNIGLESGIPVIYGILTCNTLEQAIERAGLKSGNRGFDAALAAIEMVQVMRQI